MTLTGINMPGYRVYEYLLVLLPHEELRHKIQQVRKEFADSYKMTSVPGAKPYIGLATFTQYEMMEERILNKLKLVAMAQHPFKVELKDFGSFPSHSIHINVVSRLPVQQLVKSLRTEAQRLMKLNESNKPHFMLEPHLTVANKLKPWQYEKGWLEYSRKSFTGRFVAEAMLLLKRPQGSKSWQIAQRFEFMNLPVLTRQGALFG
ncbi:MAG: 2'-5' RNA ligase family protein [Chitinophagaceae bacterium]|nr:2'-5' RNA ligase family protein [Chitinophagaceae bacterium]